MRTRLVVLGLFAALLLVHAAFVIAAPPMRPLTIEPLSADRADAPVDDMLWLARAFGPWLIHESDPELGRQDIPAAMDFDGDRDARDNWEDFPSHALLPTVYYTVVETETHYFLSYHVYHPRDWTRLALGIQDTHEGDGENVQVVVSKATMEIVVLTTQAHYKMWSYAPFPGPIRGADETLRGTFEVIEGHPVVLVESGGHGIYGGSDPRAWNRLSRVRDDLVQYKPAAEGENVTEPPVQTNATIPYRLVSLPAFLSNSTEHPTLFASPVDFEGHAMPRYHAGDRYSGPLGNSRGISPFALGYGWSRGEVGSLFWDPAARYQRALEIDGEWSTEYVGHPFVE